MITQGRTGLVPGGTGRRTNKDITKYVEPHVILRRITNGKDWDYKTDKVRYCVRDKALAALLFATSGRINEVLRLTRDQFVEYELDKDILLLSQFKVSKRKKGVVPPAPDIPLFRVGEMKGFTKLIEKYLSLLGKEEKLFKFGTSRAWAIIKNMTGLWCHWFRSQSLSFLVNKIKSATMVARQRGIEDVKTISHYYRGDWEVSKDVLKK